MRWKKPLGKFYFYAQLSYKGRIEETEFEILIDSRAELCLMSKEAFEELDFTINLTVN